MPSFGIPTPKQFREFMALHRPIKMTAEQLRFAREQAGIHREGFAQAFGQ